MKKMFFDFLMSRRLPAWRRCVTLLRCGRFTQFLTSYRVSRAIGRLGDVVSWISLFGLLAWIFLLILEEAVR